MKTRVKWSLLGLAGLMVKGVEAQEASTLGELLPLLKTQVSAGEIEKNLLQQGFVLKPGVNNARERTFQGLIDSGTVILSLRKTSKKGPVWGYRLVFQSEQQTWLQKKVDFEQRLQALNGLLGQSPSNTTKTLPQYCAGREAQCFSDGMAKYQSSWYWNNAVQRIKTVELKVNNNFETVLDITDNAMESKYELN